MPPPSSQRPRVTRKSSRSSGPSGQAARRRGRLRTSVLTACSRKERGSSPSAQNPAPESLAAAVCDDPQLGLERAIVQPNQRGLPLSLHASLPSDALPGYGKSNARSPECHGCRTCHTTRSVREDGDWPSGKAPDSQSGRWPKHDTACSRTAVLDQRLVQGRDELRPAVRFPASSSHKRV